MGLLILLLVDFIWVASSELTEYIFKNQNFRNVFLFSYQFVRVSSLIWSIFLYKTWHFDLKLDFTRDSFLKIMFEHFYVTGSVADPTFQFNADPNPTTSLSPDLDPLMLQNDPLRLPPFNSDADPDSDPAFHFDVDPDPASQNDLDPQHCLPGIRLQFFSSQV